MEIAFDFKGDPTGGVITNCESEPIMYSMSEAFISILLNFRFIRKVPGNEAFLRRKELPHLSSTSGWSRPATSQ